MDSKFIFVCSFISKHLGEAISVGDSSKMPYLDVVSWGSDVLDLEKGGTTYDNVVWLFAEKEHPEDKHPKTSVYFSDLAADMQPIYAIIGYCKYQNIECKFISEREES